MKSAAPLFRRFHFQAPSPAFVVLALIAALCLIGPLLSPHPYDRVYPAFVLAAPSLAPHPTEEEAKEAILAAVEEGAAGSGAKLAGVERRGGRLLATLESEQPFDPRALSLIAPPDLFSAARVAAQRPGMATLDLVLQRNRFPFGADANGRDLLTRTLVAGRVSLAVGLLASLVALVIGVSYGAIAGYAGGAVDAVMMRIVEIIYALPFIFFVIVLVMVFGRHFVLIFVAIGAVEWLDMARLARGQTLALKEREYVLAARALGAPPSAILLRHILPNAAGPILAFLTLLAPRVILLESFISFLGFGVQEPLASWGVLIADGARNIQGAIHLLVFPALFLGATLWALQSLGQSLAARFRGETEEPRPEAAGDGAARD